jgi:FG-GAP-like repeat
MDVGLISAPILADLDEDGDFDLLIASPQEGGLSFFSNTGTATAPAFAPPLTAFFGLAATGVAMPTFADIDGDGDLDAFAGTDNQTIFLRNLSAPCPPAPDPNCQSGFAKGSLSVSEKKAGQEKLRARLLKGPALAQLDFGNPLEAGGARVALCIYDDQGVRVARLGVDRAGELCGTKPCWKPIGKAPPDGQGFSYADKLASQDGVTSFSLKGGGEDHSSLACSAANQLQKGRAELRSGIAAALADAASVTLQVQSSAGGCFEVKLFQITEQTPARFKAH